MLTRGWLAVIVFILLVLGVLNYASPPLDARIMQEPSRSMQVQSAHELNEQPLCNAILEIARQRAKPYDGRTDLEARIGRVLVGLQASQYCLK